MTGLEEQLAKAEAQVAAMNAFYEGEDYRALPEANKAIFDHDRITALQVLAMLERQFNASRAGLG